MANTKSDNHTVFRLKTHMKRFSGPLRIWTAGVKTKQTRRNRMGGKHQCDCPCVSQTFIGMYVVLWGKAASLALAIMWQCWEVQEQADVCVMMGR